MNEKLRTNIALVLPIASILIATTSAVFTFASRNTPYKTLVYTTQIEMMSSFLSEQFQFIDDSERVLSTQKDLLKFYSDGLAIVEKNPSALVPSSDATLYEGRRTRLINSINSSMDTIDKTFHQIRGVAIKAELVVPNDFRVSMRKLVQTQMLMSNEMASFRKSFDEIQAKVANKDGSFITDMKQIIDRIGKDIIRTESTMEASALQARGLMPLMIGYFNASEYSRGDRLPDYEYSTQSARPIISRD